MGIKCPLERFLTFYFDLYFANPTEGYSNDHD